MIAWLRCGGPTWEQRPHHLLWHINKTAPSSAFPSDENPAGVTGKVAPANHRACPPPREHPRKWKARSPEEGGQSGGGAPHMKVRRGTEWQGCSSQERWCHSRGAGTGADAGTGTPSPGGDTPISAKEAQGGIGRCRKVSGCLRLPTL